MEYDRALAVYKNSPSYQAYMQAKAKGSAVIEDPEPRGTKTAERRIDIQPAEDEVTKIFMKYEFVLYVKLLMGFFSG